MYYKVFYDVGNCEGWYYEIFEDLTEALQFAEKQVESEIIGYNATIPISYNIKILY